jgi:putative redox protein
MAQAKIIQRGGALTTEIHIGGFIVKADEPLADGGANEGPAPTNLLAGALGACAAITGQLYARRKGWTITDIEIDVTQVKFKAADYPAYQGDSQFVNEFRQAITLKGDLTDEQKARVIEIMGKCPVHRLLTEPAFMEEYLADVAAAEAAPPQPPTE